MNRILGVFVCEAVTLLTEGAEVERLDKAFRKFGFPVGPLTLLDEVGFDIPTKMAPLMARELGDRFLIPKEMNDFSTEKRLGRKTKAGFYLYSSESSTKDKKSKSGSGTTV